MKHTGYCVYLPQAAFFPAISITVLQGDLLGVNALIIPIFVKNIHVRHRVSVDRYDRNILFMWVDHCQKQRIRLAACIAARFFRAPTLTAHPVTVSLSIPMTSTVTRSSFRT